MAYGLLYNLNFSSNIAGNRKHRISIYKDGHTPTITVNDNNLIGTEEPAILIWDNTDDIYSNIMSSRLEMNFYSDDVNQADVLDILDNTNPAKFKAQLYMENNSGVLQLYWEGYLSNATYEQRISSVPVTYQLIATDLLGTLKNVLTTDGTAIIDSQPTVMKYLDNVLGFLPQFSPYRISNDIQIKPFGFPTSGSFTKIHFVQWLFPFSNGFDLFGDSADEYIKNVLKVINSRLMYANNTWHIINNSTYKDTASFDIFNESANYVTTVSENVLKTIPTDFKPILNDLNIRYDTPIDTVEVTANRNEYATDFDNIVLLLGEIDNLTPYPSFETKQNSILYNQTYYSDDFTAIQDIPVVKKGNYSIKTKNIITSGNPSVKIMDTGFAGEFQRNAGTVPTFFASCFIQNSLYAERDLRIFYSIVRETSPNQSGTPVTRQYYNNGWNNYTTESQIHVIEEHRPNAPTNQWVEFKIDIPPTISAFDWARYRIILWQPRVDETNTNLIVSFDEVLLNRTNSLRGSNAIRTVSKVSGSNRKNKKYTIDFQHFYPVNFYLTEFQTDDITFTGIPGSIELNSILATQILNDNRTHIKRYTVSVYTEDFSEFLYPYHKIEIDMTGFQTTNSGIIDRLEYRAKSGIYKIDFHESNQSTNVTLDTQILQKDDPFFLFE